MFVGVWPSAEVAIELRALARPQVEGLRWTTHDQWHVTLLFLGEVPRDEHPLSELEDALLEVAAELDGPLEAALGPATDQLGPQVLCLPVTGLEQLAWSVRRHLGHLVPDRAVDRLPDGRARPFRGHLTLARARRGQRIPDRLVGVPLAASWRVDHLVLASSSPGAEGARYAMELRVPLGGRPRTRETGGSVGAVGEE